jgi:hypothetical protein
MFKSVIVMWNFHESNSSLLKQLQVERRLLVVSTLKDVYFGTDLLYIQRM